MSDSSSSDNPYLQPLPSQPSPSSPPPAAPISSPIPPAQPPSSIPPPAQSPSAPNPLVARMPSVQQAYIQRNVDYSYLNTQPATGHTQQPPQCVSRPEYAPQNLDGYIITQGSTQSSGQHRPVHWLKTGMIAAVLLIALTGTGGALYMIKTTTDSVSKAAKTRTDMMNEIMKDVDTSFTLVQKVEAGYQNPFEPSIQKSNPFADVSNPFDEIGF